MKFDVVKICAGLVIILALLMCQGVAIETTWRFSGFELWGYDINFTDHNASNINNINSVNFDDSLDESYTYLIFIDGSTIYAKNGSTGIIDYSGTEVFQVIQSVTDSFTSNGGIIEIADGIYSPSAAHSRIYLKSNTTLRGQGEATVFNMVTGGAGGGVIAADLNAYRITLKDFKIEMNNYSTNGIWLANGTHTLIDVSGVHIFDTGHTAMRLKASTILAHHNYLNNVDSGIAVESMSGANPYFYVCDNIIINTVYNSTDLTEYGEGIDINSHELSTAVVSNNYIEGFREEGIDGNAYFITISNNQIKMVCDETRMSVGIKASNAVYGHSIISNNFIWNVPETADYSSGILVLYSEGSIIANNYIFKNNSVSKGYEGMRIASSALNTTIRGNIIDHFERGIRNHANNTYSSDNLILDTVTPISNCASGETVFINNKGVAPFNFGNFATAPTPYGAGDEYYNSTDNIKYCYDGSAWEDLSDVGYYGEAYIYNNAVDTIIETANTPIALRQISGGLVNGWTFDAGSTGGITAYADGTGGTVLVSDAGHGLSNGDIITIRGTTNYNGVFTVSAVTTDNFKIVDIWVNDNGASDWDQGASLTAGANSAGIYTIRWQMSSAPDAAMTCNWVIYLNAVAQTKTTGERKFTQNDYGCCTSMGILDVSAGDVVWLAIQSDGTQNVLNKHGNFNLRTV